MENVAVIFAGGIGRRMNSKALPKQFLKLYGKEIIIYTLEHFQHHENISKIVVSCVEEWIDFLKELVEKYNLTKVVKIVPGGKTGQDSIYAGIVAAQEVSDEDAIVLIHDGVRPLINAQLISDCINTVKEKGNAITVTPAIETIVSANEDNKIVSITDRSECMLARAPQCFKLKDILQMHKRALEEEKHDFIDSASLMKNYGTTLYAVEGPVENIKITTPMDFYTFKALCEARENSQLFGI
ncbi:2-C-methyl-D-erythritol 4-phosphate cytidylyltransferase [Lachnoclostridium sp. An181]|uniref:2-C-methyl-D-erythritol 4-phosphate cytidylyltransferase n=1 Tax=Lachnoclostridium sp. An181 TaxID=1965575 RepID=UPI000B37901E|nr:2-C-methyl-D-erythritol 4-phosphate cytidylyltransferase [Lachnoclostridium sp. An181]OUP49750.1 2-C-methyl-D-erythritol 4-phosphate cytidylyltransferase [Lachnoclostridium sp. An181]